LIVLPISIVLVWHTVENDLALASGIRSSGRIAPLSLTPRDHRWLLIASPLILLLMASTAEFAEVLGWRWRPWPIRVVDLVGAPVLYHLASWLRISIDRVRAEHAQGRSAAARRRAAQIVLVHVVPIVICLATLDDGGLPVGGLARAFHGPDLYLFWSLVHVVQTSLARRGVQRAPSTRLRVHIPSVPRAPRMEKV
jgi:hypothetical protein